jgi:hypothetical protein
MNIWERMMNIDRRWIYLLVGICVIVPLLYPIGLPTFTTPYTKALFDFIDHIPPDGPAILISFDFDPATAPELLPMAEAILRHCFAKDINVLCLGLYPTYIGMIDMALSNVKDEYGARSGEDFVFLPYVPGVTAVMLSMGENIKETFGRDYYGVLLDSLPMMRHIRNYDDIALVLSISGSALPQSWAVLVGTTYHVKVGVGTTAVSAAEYYSWLQTGQFVGMLGGLKGAAEYENLIDVNRYMKKDTRKVASMGMDAQSFVHILMIALIIIGNIAYFNLRKKS